MKVIKDDELLVLSLLFGGSVVRIAHRAAGVQFGAAPFRPLSGKAMALGMETPADVEAEYQRAKEGWSKGTDYHCPFCDKDFWSSSGAKKHQVAHRHRVLRWDWYGEVAG